MLWRVRTTLPDRPGSLATLSRRCGEGAVNILGLQIFPGIGRVTDELVLRVPDDWVTGQVADLVESAGGTEVSVTACTEHALVDGPTRYLQAVRRLLRAPDRFPEILAALLDAEPADAARRQLSPIQDTLAVRVGDRSVAVRRTPAFSASEHARAAAFAELAAELLEGYGGRPVAPVGQPVGQPVVRPATAADVPAVRQMHRRCSADTIHRRYATPLAHVDERLARRLVLAGAGAVVAACGSDVVGLATVAAAEAGVCDLTLLVEDGWQRRGIGTRLLAAAARQARAHGAAEVVLRSGSLHPALAALAFGSGLRARIRLLGDGVEVTIGVEGLEPLPPAVAPSVSRAPAPA